MRRAKRTNDVKMRQNLRCEFPGKVNHESWWLGCPRTQRIASPRLASRRIAYMQRRRPVVARVPCVQDCSGEKASRTCAAEGLGPRPSPRRPQRLLPVKVTTPSWHGSKQKLTKLTQTSLRRQLRLLLNRQLLPFAHPACSSKRARCLNSRESSVAGG